MVGRKTGVESNGACRVSRLDYLRVSLRFPLVLLIHTGVGVNAVHATKATDHTGHNTYCSDLTGADHHLTMSVVGSVQEIESRCNYANLLFITEPLL